MIDMMITMSLPALNLENPRRDTVNRWESFRLHTPRFFLCFQASCWNLTVPVRVLILPTFPPSLKLLSILVFSTTPYFPHLELCHCYLFYPVPSFEPKTIPAQIACADSDLSGMNQISAHSLLVLAWLLQQLSAGCADTARSLRNGTCQCQHSDNICYCNLSAMLIFMIYSLRL